MSGLSRIVALGGCLMLLLTLRATAQDAPKGPVTFEEQRREAEKQQLDKMVGKWSVAGLRCEGKTTKPEGYEISIQKEKVNDRDGYTFTIFKDKKEERKFRIVQLNPLQLPAWIDLDTLAGDFRGTQVYGVYEMSERSLFVGLPLEANTASSRVRDLSGGVGTSSLRLELVRAGETPPK